MNMDIKEQCCENCVYIEKHADKKGFPYCRRFPPQVFQLPDEYEDLSDSAYPNTENGQWCGEWKQKTKDI